MAQAQQHHSRFQSRSQEPIVRLKSTPPEGRARETGIQHMQRGAPTSTPREEIDTLGEDEDEFVSFQGQGGQSSDSNRLTKNGMPDRRLKGQRDLPDEIVVPNPGYRRPAVGEMDEEGIHRTKDGKPDRRFLENRALTAHEAKVKQAEYFIAHRDEIGVDDGRSVEPEEE